MMIGKLIVGLSMSKSGFEYEFSMLIVGLSMSIK
jgi:hypothetical protein